MGFMLNVYRFFWPEINKEMTRRGIISIILKKFTDDKTIFRKHPAYIAPKF